MSDKIAPNIIDNSPERELIKVLKDQLRKSKEAKFAIGYFFLSGFSLVKEDFPENYQNLPFLKIVMGNETTYPTKEELVAGYNLREIFKQRMIEDLQRTKLTAEQIKQLEALRDFIANNIIDVKLFDKSRLHAKLYLFLTKPEEKYGSPGLAVVGSSNFTAEGLTQNKELNVLLTSREEVLYLNQWFDELWNEAVEFQEDLLKVIDISGVLPGSPYPKIGRLIDPHTLFKYLVYKWFEGRVLNLLKKDILLEFQLVGVVNATDKSDFYNGVILADSVGLGKSFMASAVIEEFLNGKHPTWIPNEKSPSVMLILPPSIISQWEELLMGNIDEQIKEKLFSNQKIKIPPIFEEERGFFVNNYKKLTKKEDNYKIYEIYDEQGEKLLGKISFLSLGIFQNLKEAELKRIAEEYDLFVIDEAHKYRNKNTNRWKNVRKLQKKEDGFPNKFLLLTATPLNNTINDIFNMIRLFVDDTFAPFRIKGVPITELIKKYRDLKKELQKRDDDKTKKDLKRVATEIKQKILDEIMILRTRKYIMEQFKDIKVNGKPLIFKDPKPYSLDYSPFYTKGYRALIKVISDNLDRLLFEYTKLYGTRYVVFEEETIDEEEPVKKLIDVADLFKLLLGKRLESGIYPFETTLKRIYAKEKIFYEIFKEEINRIFTRKDLEGLIKSAVERAKIEKELEEIKEEYNIEEEDEETWFDRVVKIFLEYAEELKEEGKQYSEIDFLKLGLSKVLENLESDLRLMDNIFTELDKLKEKENDEEKTLGKIPRKMEDIIDLPIYSYKNDPKLESLKQIIGTPSFKSQKLENIPPLNRKKIVIFTQYKDTAYYLYHRILDWIEKEVDLHTWLKDEKDRIKIALVTGDTETPTKINYIKRFAPQANSGFEEVSRFGEIDILISTDALSEGVNLQDADAVVNYDLPWNPMIIVQRVGRSGHKVGKVSKGVILTTNAEDLAESLVIARRALAGQLESLKVRHNPLSVLANQIIAIALEYGEIESKRMYKLIKRSYPFHDLSWDTFSTIIGQLRDQRTIWLNEDKTSIIKRTRSRDYFLDNISMIPDEKSYRVIDISSRTNIGKLDESFVLSYGFEGAKLILRGRPWIIIKREEDSILVSPIKELGTIPSWVGEDIPVPFEVSLDVGKLRRYAAEGKKIVGYPCNKQTLNKFLQQISNQKEQGFVVPDDKTITVEVEDKNVVINACFGTKVNETLGRLLSSLLAQSLGESVGINSDSYRINLELPGHLNADRIKDILMKTKPESVEYLIETILRNSTYIRWQLIHVARKFGALRKDFDYKNVGIRKLLTLFDNSSVFDEAIDKLIWERMDIENTKRILNDIQNGTIKLHIQRISPMSLLGFETMRGLMIPQRADRSILMALKKRLEDVNITLVCINCNYTWNTTVGRADQQPRCSRCGAIKIAVLQKYNKDSAKLLSKKDRTKKENKEVLRIHKNASLVLSYGKFALYVLMGRGIGSDTAARILRKFNRSELKKSDEMRIKLLREILKAELTYARTRGFWPNN